MFAEISTKHNSIDFIELYITLLIVCCFFALGFEFSVGGVSRCFIRLSRPRRHFVIRRHFKYHCCAESTFVKSRSLSLSATHCMAPFYFSPRSPVHQLTVYFAFLFRIKEDCHAKVSALWCARKELNLNGKECMHI